MAYNWYTVNNKKTPVILSKYSLISVIKLFPTIKLAILCNPKKNAVRLIKSGIFTKDFCFICRHAINECINTEKLSKIEK